MAIHSSVLAWRISGMGERGGLPSMPSHRVERDWNDLAAAAAYIYMYSFSDYFPIIIGKQWLLALSLKTLFYVITLEKLILTFTWQWHREGLQKKQWAFREIFTYVKRQECHLKDLIQKIILAENLKDMMWWELRTALTAITISMVAKRTAPQLTNPSLPTSVMWPGNLSHAAW